ncbi:type I polyketide synthase, partial [Streptomyces sp. NPDC059788]|uniref:type I polyketide synthase n=1 Tax=Streptomyces sp. NPDC059788 TaxID=3346948 RepID=UPI00366A50B5
MDTTAAVEYDESFAPEDAIAVVGIACRFAQAATPGEFWQLLRDGKDVITEVPADRWDAEALYDPDPAAPGRMISRWGSFLDHVDHFDPAFFRISPREAAAMDPQQRLMLELGWEALEDAGVVPARIKGSRLGIFVGAIWDDYARLVYRDGAEHSTQHSVTGFHRSIIANRLSHFLGVHGPSMVVDTGQSSSLVAVHLAAESLRQGESDVALAGGVNLSLLADSSVISSKWGGMSPDGRCYTFDARANGYVRGEGGGAVLLKRLSQAVADGDRVYGVIRGSAVNNGSGSTMSTPSGKAQEELLRSAYRAAGVAPAEVQYVELHGTGTPVGDPIEAGALGAVLGTAEERTKDHPAGPLHVGSVKTNLGHLEGAAGIAGLIKAVLSLHHKQLPPSLNFETPNPRIPLDELNLVVQRELGPWPQADRPLVAGISSFGMGGTNCHVVLAEWRHEAEAGAEAAVEVAVERALPVVPWVVSGRSEGALRAQAERLAGAVAVDVRPVDVGLSLVSSRSVFEHRAVVLGGDRDGLLSGVGVLAGGGVGVGVVSGVVVGGGLGLVFTGQGSQRVGMGRGLYEVFPVFAGAFDEVCGLFDGVLGRSVRELVWSGVDLDVTGVT